MSTKAWSQDNLPGIILLGIVLAAILGLSAQYTQGVIDVASMGGLEASVRDSLPPPQVTTVVEDECHPAPAQLTLASADTRAAR